MSKYCLFLIVIYYLTGPLVGKCPKCGNNIVLKKSFYGCSNYPECKFTIATDKHGRNAFLYADDIDLIKYIISNEPSIMWSVDSEGRNIFHFLSMKWCSDPLGCQVETIKELFRVIPSELLHQPDNNGKHPSDYLYVCQDS